MVDTHGKENERIRKYKVVLQKGGGEASKLENMEYEYASVHSWGTEEEDEITFTSWKGVGE